MKLTVITICYNIKDVIARTCESIINQTYQDFEWVLIDGGSTDGTLEILEKYRNRINVFVSENDNGIYHAMNKGINFSSGEYLNFMNGGDVFFENDILEKSIKYFKTSADIYYANANFIKPKGKNFLKMPPHHLIDEYFIYDCIPHQSTFIKRKLFAKYGNYDETFRIVADYEKWIVFIQNSRKFEYIDLIVSNHYYDGVSSNNFDNTHEKERAFVVDKYYKNKKPKSFYKKIITKKIMGNNTRYLLFGYIPLLRIKEIS